MKIVFTADGRCASAVVEPAGQPITAGSRGVPAEIHLSPEYDGLVVTAFFRSEYGAWPVVLGETPGTVTIPWEAMEKKSLTFDVGVVGKNGDGTIVIPTIWARAGKIVPATEDSGLEPGDPSADIGAQIVEQARAAAKKAEDAAAAAEDARDKMPRIVDGTWRVYNAVTESWEDTGIQAEGQDGVGISGAVLNANYTLTLTFTDGSSYTTPPIRGAQGERGPIGPTPDISIGTVTTGAAGSQAEATMTGTQERPVLNLTIPRGDPGEVTQAEFDDLAGEVAQQKSAIDDLTALTNRKAGMLVDTASGAIASFVPDATIDNLLGVSVAVEPVQDLHGYDAPWPAGGGVNKFSGQWPPDVSGTYAGWYSGATTSCAIKIFDKANGADISGIYFGVGVNGTTTPVHWLINNGNIARTEDVTYASGTLYPYVTMYPNNRETLEKVLNRFDVLVAIDGADYSTYAPYENVCPISGWDSVEVDADGENLLPYPPPKSAASRTETFNPETCFLLKQGTYTFAFDRFDNATSWRFGIVLFDARKERYYVPSEILGNDFGHNDSGRYYVNSSNNTNTTFSLIMPFDGFIRLFFLLGDTTDASVCVNPRICIGTTATAFKPYAGNRYTITLGDTVYGGTLTIAEDGSVNALIDRAMVDLGTLTWAKNESSLIGLPCFFATIPGVKPGAPYFNCSEYAINRDRDRINATGQIAPGNASNATYCVARDDRYASADATTYKTAVSGVQLVYELATPITITLDPVTIATIANQTNNVWSDAGDVSVEFAADLKHYIDSKIAAAVAALS